MARNDKKRQKKLEKKRMDRKKQKADVARVKSGGLSTQLAQAAKWPIYRALKADFESEEGLESLMLVRHSGTGTFALTTFLVDRYCCGVKDTFGKILPGETFAAFEERRITNTDVPQIPVSPAYIRKLVEESVAYAREIGIEPHADYSKVAQIFGDIDASACTEEFEFGSEGKPLYITGPDDNPATQLRIMTLVEKAGGKFVLDDIGRFSDVDFDEFDDDDLFDDDVFDEDDEDDQEDESRPVVLETTFTQVPK